MKYAINIFTQIFLGHPAMVVGYLYAAVKEGFDTGVYFHGIHEKAAIKKFYKGPQ